MKICPKCGTENPDQVTTCTNCGHKFRVESPDDGNESAELRETIEGLQMQLAGKSAELDSLKSTSDSKDEVIAGLQRELIASQAEVDSLRKKIDGGSTIGQASDNPSVPPQPAAQENPSTSSTAKAAAQAEGPTSPETQSGTSPKPAEQALASSEDPATQQPKDKESFLGALMNEVEKEIHIKKPADAAKDRPALNLSIESYPLKKPNFHLAIDDAKPSLDLSATLFRIRATVARSADGIEVVVANGATLNIRLSENQKWQRYTGGKRIKAVPGMILFDPTGSMNARLESGS
jgi:hypothetical protein